MKDETPGARYFYEPPRTDEQIARGAQLKTWNRPKVFRRSRREYCLKCGGLHRKGKCPGSAA